MKNGTGTRQEQILYLLLEHRTGLGIDEIASFLGISRNAVKQHLVVLETLRLIKKDSLKSTKGRPLQNYVLTEQGINHFPKQYSWFCNLLMAQLREELGENGLEDFMEKLGVKLAATLKFKFKNQDANQKIKTLVDIMQTLGYEAVLEETPETPVIKATNCVYHDIAQEYPAICIFDRTLIAHLIEQPINQVSCMANKDCNCRFKIEDEVM